MAFLPGLTKTRSSQNVKRRSKRRETVTKSGYRISFADINKTTEHSDSNVVARCPDGTNDTDRRALPPLEETKIGVVADFNEEVKSKPLKLPKCPSSVINSNSMFWIEPLGLWVPLRQGRKLYEKFTRGINLLCKDPDYSMDPCPHIPRCDHSRSWSAVKLERQKFRELRELRNKQSLEKTLERYRNMQEFWLEQMNSRSDMLHATPSHLRLQSFRKTTGFLAPLNEAQRFERLQERHEKQREWEETWKLACEKRRKADRKKNSRNILPQIIVTEYEFVFTCDEHVNASDQSHDIYFEESYHVICRPVQYISDENLKTQFLSNRLQRFQNQEPARCDPYTGLNPAENVTASSDSSEKETENFESSGNKYRSFPSYGNFATKEPYTRLDHTNKKPEEPPLGNRLDSPRDKNAGIRECDESTSESSITQDPILVTSYTCSGSSLDTVVAEVCTTAEIKHADNTADLMRRLVPVPLGVSSRRISDPQLTASSVLDVYHTADQARLHNEKHDKKGGAWLPKKHDVNPYLQVDLGHVTTIHQVATQGNPASAVKNERHKRWVTKYSLEFSQDGNNWTDYLESGELKIFTGNSDLETVVLNSLENAVETRYVRFRPKEWHNGIAMRVEVLGSNPFPDEQREEIQTPITETDIVEESGNETTEEKTDDSLVVQNQETQKFFSEMDMNSENIEFGLLVEERVVTPPVVHSPVPSLLSPREQKVEIEHIMESQICSQNLRLKEFSDLSEVESTTTQELRDDTQSSSSPNADPLIENSEVLTSDETEEFHSQLSKEDTSDTNDIGDTNDTSETSDTSESTPSPASPENNPTPHATPPPVVPSPPPSSPPCEGWAHALERARADGSIQQQLMREKMAEERRKKLAMLDAKRKRQITEQTLTTEYLDELGNFLEKYCIIKKSDQMIYKNIFEKFDEDSDGFLWPEEVLEALENVNVKRLSDAHLRYVFRVLEHCECQADIGIGFRLFSLIAALSQRVALLNDKMKKLITKCDFKTLDCTLERVKMLFECYVNQDTMRIYRTDLWIGLAAGGLRSAEAKIEDYFSDKNSFDFLDFLTYLPLFQEIHGHVVENPLTLF